MKRILFISTLLICASLQAATPITLVEPTEEMGAAKLEKLSTAALYALATSGITLSDATINVNTNFNLYSFGGTAITPSNPLKVQQGDLNRTNDNVTTYFSTVDSNNLYNVYLYGSSVLTNAISTGSILTTNTSTTVPVVLGTTNTVFRTVTFVGYHGGRIINANTVWIQFSSTNEDNAIPILPGQSLSFPAMERSAYNASQFYIDVDTANDGVMALWVK